MRISLFIDGGFIVKKYKYITGNPLTSDAVGKLVEAIKQHEVFSTPPDLFRIYYYDCKPLESSPRNPITGENINFASTPTARAKKHLLEGLEKLPHTAIRLGKLDHHGWEINDANIKKAVKSNWNTSKFKASPAITQKRVDMKIGLDIAWLALNRFSDAIVLIASDSDFVPILKFARTHGIITYLVRFGHGVQKELLVHTDVDIDIDLKKI